MDKLNTKSVKLKVASVVIGLLAMALTAASVGLGAYYHSTCDETISSLISSGALHARHHHLHNSSNFSSSSRWGHLPNSEATPLTCEEATPNTEDNCHSMNKRMVSSTGETELKSCPSKWLVIPPLAIIALIWTTTVIMLVIGLVVDLNKKMPSFPNLDRIGHWTAGALMLLMGALMAGFLLMVLLGDYPCDSTIYDEAQRWSIEKEEWEQGSRQFLSVGGLVRWQIYDFYFRAGILKRTDYRTCASLTNRVYQPWLLLIGTVFTGLAGILYIVTGMALKMQGMRQPTPGMMMGQGEGQQISQQPSQMGYQNSSQFGYQQTPSQMGYQQQQYPQMGYPQMQYPQMAYQQQQYPQMGYPQQYVPSTPAMQQPPQQLPLPPQEVLPVPQQALQ